MNSRGFSFVEGECVTKDFRTLEVLCYVIDGSGRAPSPLPPYGYLCAIPATMSDQTVSTLSLN